MNGAVAAMGSLLQMKPLLKMYDGNPTAERVRTNNGATERLVSLLSDLSPLERVAFVHAHAPAKAEALRQKVQHLLPKGKALSVEITPVLGANIGPSAAGFACVTARKE
jgi:fatty acid-binding protein DegV